MIKLRHYLTLFKSRRISHLYIFIIVNSPSDTSKFLSITFAHQKPRDVASPRPLVMQIAFTFKKKKADAVNKSLVHNHVSIASPTRVHRYLLRDSCNVDSVAKLKPLEWHYNFFSPLPPEAANVLSGLPERPFGWKSVWAFSNVHFRNHPGLRTALAAANILPGVKVNVLECRVDAQLPVKADQRIVLMLLTREEGRRSTG